MSDSNADWRDTDRIDFIEEEKRELHWHALSDEQFKEHGVVSVREVLDAARGYALDQRLANCPVCDTTYPAWYDSCPTCYQGMGDDALQRAQTQPVLIGSMYGLLEDVSKYAERQEQLIALWKYVEEFVAQHGIHCSETIYQTDRVQLAAAEFVEGAVKIVGYLPVEDDE